MSNTSKSPETKVITGKVRFSYPHVWEASAMNEGETPVYSVSLLIPKSDTKTIAKIKKAIEAAKQIGKNTVFGGRIPANLKTPLRDGDEEKPDKKEYEGCYFVNATSRTRPGVVDINRDPITVKEDFYPGCYGIASLNFFPYNKKGIGISAGLNNLMKTADGESLGGRQSAEDDFANVEIPEEADGLL